MKDATSDELKQKMRILNAYYFPDGDPTKLYPSITPVNSFRTLFNMYFNAQYPLLPDKSYIFENMSGYVYDFSDVTDRVSDAANSEAGS